MLNPLEVREKEAIPSLGSVTNFMRAALTVVAYTPKREAHSVKRKIVLGHLDFMVGFKTVVRGFQLLEIGWVGAE